MSNYIVSARKYRPATFDEVVGQAHVADTLKNALESDKLAHSFLFCGPRGVGKTTCARILAKVINCEDTSDKTNPCNACSSCISFNDNASFNIIELDAASNNSVDNIRNLIDQVRIPPQQGRYKVFIIDEVHMLSTAAFNAFLKTLEEPPSYAIFILATTEKHKILPTILSRCQIFDFKRIQVSAAAEQLRHICTQEGITAEPEALHLIGQKADGAMRDALSIFDKVAASSHQNITYKDVIASLNILDYEYYFKVVDAFLKEDLSQVLLLMDEVITQGFDVEIFIQGLGSHLRDLLVCKDTRTQKLLDVSEGLRERYVNQSQYATRSMLLSGLDILNQCDIALARSTNKRLFAEIALSKINFAQRTIDAHILTGDSAEKKTLVETEQPSPTPKITENQQSKKANTQPTIPVKEEKSVEKNKVETKKPAPIQKEVTTPKKITKRADLSLESMMAVVKAEKNAAKAAKENFSIESIRKIWKEYADLNPSPSVQATLNQAELRLVEEYTLEVTVPSAWTGEIIKNEGHLLDRMRTELGANMLVYVFNVDPEAFPDFEERKPASKLSAREKYVLLVEKKPELKELVSQLDLKPDTEI